MRFHEVLAAAVLLALLAASPAAAQVTGRIVGPGATRIEIALSPLAEGEGGHGEAAKFGEVLARDLTLSGFFRVLEPQAYIEGPLPIDPSQINWGNWQVIGAKVLTKGSIRVSGGQVDVEARVFDVVQHIQVGGARYTGDASDVHRIARRFADKVLELATGELGPFDSKIVFTTRRSGVLKQIMAMSVDGFEVAPITSNRTINLAPSWSPDVSSIPYTSYRDGNPSLYRLELAGGPDRKISASHGLNLGGRWSPDGRTIAISLERNGNSDIYLLDPSGQVRAQLTKGSEIDVSPSWSPDGSHIAFVSSRAGNPQVYVMNADGSGERRLTFQGSYNTSPNWSPKGDLVAYVSRDAGFNVFTVTVEGGQVRQITSGQGNNEDPSFSPDGRYLVFSSTRVGRAALFLSDLTGVHQVQLTKSGGDDTSPSWSPRLR